MRKRKNNHTGHLFKVKENETATGLKIVEYGELFAIASKSGEFYLVDHYGPCAARINALRKKAIDLTPAQKEAVISATPENSFHYRAHQSTQKSLDLKGVSKYSYGFGWKYGAISELTNEGKILREILLHKQEAKQASI